MNKSITTIGLGESPTLSTKIQEPERINSLSRSPDLQESLYNIKILLDTGLELLRAKLKF